MATAVYRGLLRSCNQAFRNDVSMLKNAKSKIRSEFEVSAAERDPDRLKQLFAEGEEASDFIKTFVVQAELNDRGSYAMQVEKHHADTVAEEAELR
ncbi:hypothetical protein WJX73_009437 [Symbiochloris irregularis]|uniref:Complex 1 LYR protein domain-containing protein n=1 Tax=Symbiochloris irregularis TaxID=706552 RepID=A0AAW1P073_9CHLO